MDIFEVVQKLTGPIEPVGETHTDNRRLDNQVTFMLLAQQLVLEIIKVSKNATRHEASMKKAGEYALKCLQNIKDDIED
jgi:hypothetical protein